MATFVYKVHDRTGKIFTGNMEGESKAAIVSRLQEMDYFITSVNEKKKNILFFTQINLFKGIKFRDLTIFFRQFSVRVTNISISLVIRNKPFINFGGPIFFPISRPGKRQIFN